MPSGFGANHCCGQLVSWHSDPGGLRYRYYVYGSPIDTLLICPTAWKLNGTWSREDEKAKKEAARHHARGVRSCVRRETGRAAPTAEGTTAGPLRAPGSLSAQRGVPIASGTAARATQAPRVASQLSTPYSCWAAREV